MSNTGHYQAFTAEIIRLLCEERKKRGISNYEVAQRSGLRQSTLSRIEHGLRNPSLEVLLKTSDAIGVDLENVIKKARRNAKKSS